MASMSSETASVGIMKARNILFDSRLGLAGDRDENLRGDFATTKLRRPIVEDVEPNVDATGNDDGDDEVAPKWPGRALVGLFWRNLCALVVFDELMTGPSSLWPLSSSTATILAELLDDDESLLIEVLFTVCALLPTGFDLD